MSAMQERVLAAINELSDGLPKNGRLRALEYLIEKISTKDLSKLSEEVRTRLLEGLSLPSNEPIVKGKGAKFEPQIDIYAERDAFIKKYDITRRSSLEIRLTLPEGVTRIDFLKEAQAISTALHASARASYYEKQAILPERLKLWESDPGFTETTKGAVPIHVTCDVRGLNYSRVEQEERGLNNVSLRDLAVAHVAYYLVWGNDLFGGNVVRAADGAMSTNGLGLGCCKDKSGSRSSKVSASRSLLATS